MLPVKETDKEEVMNEEERGVMVCVANCEVDGFISRV